MKKALLALGFVFALSTSGFAKENDEKVKVKATVKVESVAFGNCTFSYTLTATNSETGETVSRTYTHSVDAISESDCRGQANRHAAMHARIMAYDLNN